MAAAKRRGRRAAVSRFELTGVLLAAGTSSRMGEPKPLVKVRGRRMIDRVLRNLREAGIDRIVVVVGDHANEVRAAIPSDGITVVDCADFRKGMSHSLRAGLKEVGPESRWVMTILADQPFVSPETLRRLARRAEEGDGSIFLPTYRGVWGNPVVFAASLAPDLETVEGDVGCRAMFPRRTSEIREVPVDDPGILVDFDTPAEIAAFERSVDAGEPLKVALDHLAEPRWSLHSTPAEHPVPKRLARSAEVTGLAERLREERVPFALATVVRSVRPTSGRPGYKALVREDGSHVGWVGGACTETLLVTEAREAMRTGAPRLLRVSPEPSSDPEEGVVERAMSCASGGTVEIFIEPNLPKPNLVIVGDSPVATSLAALGPLLGYRVVLAAPGTDPDDVPEVDVLVNDLAALRPHLTPATYAVVASMGKYDETALAVIARAPVAFVGLVASRKRARSVLAAAKEEGVSADELAKVRNPVGIDISALTPEEIALSVMAELTKLRRGAPPPAPVGVSPAVGTEGPAIDPVCHMEVERTSPLRHDHAGTTYFFCSDGCRRKFAKGPAKYLAA
jgi:xanthine dehydrogenase accessory factor